MEKLTIILKELEQGKISADNAEEQVLRLFNVVGLSEQLVCDVCGSTDNIQTYCGKCMDERC